MFIHTLESLEEFEDYIKQLDENVGLKPETYKEVMKAISKERTKLKKLIIGDVVVPKGTLCECNWPLVRTGTSERAEYCGNCGKDI